MKKGFITRRVFGVVLLLLLAYCRAGDSKQGRSDPEKKPLVFIHGIMGGTLVNPDGEVVWLSPSAGLGLSTPDLSLPVDWSEQKQATDDLLPAGSLKEVTALFGLLGEKIYAPWTDFAGNLPNHAFYDYSYDWRRDNNETADRFIQFLKEISKKHGGKKVNIVSHSMGGMITLVALNEQPNLIGKVVFAGVPFKGGLGYLDNLYLGTPIGSNNEILSAEVMFTYPSVYSFFPAGQSFENKGLIVDENGNSVNIDFHSLKDWKQYGLGLFANQNEEKFERSPEEISHLKYVLEQNRKFRKRMNPANLNRERKYQGEMLVISAKVHATLSKVRMIISDGSQKPLYNFDIEPKVPGDGSVTYQDMLPPEPVRYKEFETKYRHTAMLSDPAVQKAIQSYLEN